MLSIKKLWSLKNCRLPAHPVARNRMLLVLSLLLLGSCLVDNIAADDEITRERQPEGWKTDANLRDVFFLNPQLGWAVGGNGTILKTTDGGETWLESRPKIEIRQNEMRLNEKVRDLQAGRITGSTGVTGRVDQLLPYTCHLDSVFFVDPQHGWIAGGYRLPLVDRSRGLILRTTDGGVTWHQVEHLKLPRIRRVEFLDSRNGWAIGDAGSLSPSGVFFTSNGGRSWSVRDQTQGVSWLDAEVPRNAWNTVESQAIGLDLQGQPIRLFGGKWSHAVLSGLRSRVSFRAIEMLDENSGYAVGAEGTVAETQDGGRSWSQLPIQREMAPIESADWLSLAVTSKHLWAVGQPGHVLMSVDRASGDVQLAKLPDGSILNRIRFLDDQHGWAVGRNGVILATTDGGQTWRRQRGRRKPVAMMLVAPSASDVPLELLGRYGLEENQRCSVVVLEDTIVKFEIARQAAERLGSVSSTLLKTAGNGPEPDQPSARLLDFLAAEIRAQQPRVVVCGASPDALGSGQELTSVESMVRQAIRLAAETSRNPQVNEFRNLLPHQVTRLVVADPAGEHRVNQQRLIAATGEALEQRVALSRGLLDQELFPATPLRFRVVELNGTRAEPRKPLLDGISRLATQRVARPTRDGNLAQIRQAGQRRQKLEELANFRVQQPNDILIWNRQVEIELNQLDPATAGDWLVQLTDRYLQADNLKLAARTAEMLVTRAPQNPYSLAGLNWLAHYHASDEYGCQQKLVASSSAKSSDASSQRAFESRPRQSVQDNVTTLRWKPLQPPSLPDEDEEAPSKTNSTKLPDSQVAVARWQRAAKIANLIADRDPEFSARPESRWLRSQIARRLAEQTTISAQPPAQRFENLKRKTDAVISSHGWASVQLGAQRELLMLGHLSPNDPATPRYHLCQPTSHPPLLDGKLNDVAWRKSSSILQTVEPEPSGAKGWMAKTEARLGRSTDLQITYDHEFLYLGLVCNKLEGVPYHWKPGPRSRDADLSGRDRVAIQIDTDRDYQTAFRLELDHRGWLRESCDRFTGWDPNWYVAQAESDHHWSIEAAIPIRELVATAPQAGEAWAISIQRLGDESQVLSSPWKFPLIQSRTSELLVFESLPRHPQETPAVPQASTGSKPAPTPAIPESFKNDPQ